MLFCGPPLAVFLMHAEHYGERGSVWVRSGQQAVQDALRQFDGGDFVLPGEPEAGRVPGE